MTPVLHEGGPGVAQLVPDADARGLPVRICVLSRHGCHLCARVVGVVESVCAGQPCAGFVVVDIDDAAAVDPQVLARYGDLVPVVFVDGVRHDYYTVDPARLARALE